jgi:large subunit ribosomal protein L25
MTTCCAGERVVLKAEAREQLGSDESRRLRRAGLVPAIVYVREATGVAANYYVALPVKEITREYSKRNVVGRLFDLEIDGKKELVVLYDFVTHPVTGALEHIEFNAVRNDEVFARVPVVFYNHSESLPVKRGAFLLLMKRVVGMTCKLDTYKEMLAVDLLTADLTSSRYTVGDLPLPAGCHLRDCSQKTLVAKFLGKRVGAADAATAGAEAKDAKAKKPAKAGK